MTKDEYCLNVCHGKCCFTPAGVPCPKRTPEGACSIYYERYTLGQPFKWNSIEGQRNGRPKVKTFVCGTMEEIIKGKTLPPAVRAQCVYVHPELADQ